MPVSLAESRPDASAGLNGGLDDHAALRAACEDGAGLCTIVGIEGSFSRRLGAQLAITAQGDVVGSLSDGCLEQELVTRMARARADGQPAVQLYGSGSDIIDFRLPCGSGLDILIDPTPDRAELRQAVALLEARQGATLRLPVPRAGLLDRRHYMPSPRLLIFGHGPEVDALVTLAAASDIDCISFRKDDPASGLSLGRTPTNLSADAQTAIILLFHDHEWELPILEWAVATPAHYIGAQGGADAREARRTGLERAGLSSDQIARVRSPIGLIPKARDPQVLALSVLADVIADYECLHDRAADAG
ncbi:XdhC family protein [Altererythrobacter sp. SALINAS58]|uniref:XdhC family protein n=1 Tax=Alteripontixanthobacter muriae TaxID=2705546 RepID=UPI001576D8DD|nr:XdhC family protein [Alteripontixanthobacter muriae]NTZ43102.1 XdhC family protein [Alteripontixanthobacter muriae]